MIFLEGVIMNIRVLILTIFFISINFLYCRELITVIVASYPPFSIVEDEIDDKSHVTGINVDVLKLFNCKYKDYEIIFNVYPPARFAKMINDERHNIDIFFDSPFFVDKGLTRFFDYAGKIVTTEDKVITYKDNTFLYEGPEDLYNKRVGIILGYSYGMLDSLFSENLIISDPVITHTQNIRKLMYNRIDAYLGNIHVSPYFMIEEGLSPNDFIFSEVNLFSFDYGIFVNRNKKELLIKLKEFIKEISESGELRTIINNYIIN